MSKRASTLWIALFFVLLTVVGLVTAGDYGLPLDGLSEQVILEENLKEYAFQLLGEDSAQVQKYDALGIDRITESIEMDHWQAAYYLAAPLLGLRDTRPGLFNTLWHAYTWLWFMAGVLAAYALCRDLGLNRVLACAAALLLYLSPRFFAEGHYNNKDVVLMALTLWTIAAGVRFFKKPAAGRALVFALAGALAANTRIIGFFVFGVMGIMIVVTLLIRREMSKRTLRNGLAAIAGFAVIYMLITPAFLVNPVGFITHVLSNAAAFTRWPGVVIFKGAVYDQTGGTPLPHSYLPTMIALTVPIPVLVLAAIGGLYALALCIQGDKRRPVLIAIILLFIVPVAYAVIKQPLMYNGWRHFYFLYGPMIALAGLGLLAFQNLLWKRRAGKIAGIAALALALGWQGIGIALNHPYEYAYYNELARDEQTAFELDYWEVSTLNAVELLLESGERNGALPLELAGGDHMSALSLTYTSEVFTAEQRTALTLAEEGAEEPAYVLSNTTYAQIYSAWPDENYKVLFSLESYGNVICTVYERIE